MSAPSPFYFFIQSCSDPMYHICQTTPVIPPLAMFINSPKPACLHPWERLSPLATTDANNQNCGNDNMVFHHCLQMSLIDSDMGNMTFSQKLFPKLEPPSILFAGEVSPLTGPTQPIGARFTPTGFEPSTSTDCCHPNMSHHQWLISPQGCHM